MRLILFTLCLIFVISIAQQSILPESVAIRDSRLTRLISYLNIHSVQPNPDYKSNIDFLKTSFDSIGIPSHVLTIHPGYPIFIAKWQGKNTTLPSIMLNSHMDIVKADASLWTTKDPFVAEVRDRKIFVRGIQDMKSVGMQHFEAISALKQQGYQPERTIYVTYVPDEEIGGDRGMNALVDSEYFAEMNVGLEIDEGLASENDVYSVFTGERIAFWVVYTVEGPVGHGSTLPANSTGEKFQRLLKRIFEKRDQLVKEKEETSLGAVISINLTAMKGGEFTAVNVIPSEIEFCLDMRVPGNRMAEFHDFLEELKSMESGVKYRFHNLHGDRVVPFDTEKSEWWTKFQTSLVKMGLKYEKLTFAAATDARYIRLKSIPAIGFSPMINTPVLLHGHDEHLAISTYLDGIDVFANLIRNLDEL